MAKILLPANELTKQTIVGGNVDTDRFLPAVKAAQQVAIKPLLGKELYDKLCDDFNDGPDNGSLSGLYLEMYEEFIKLMVSHKSAEIYLENGAAYLVTNNGITKSKTESSETVDRNEIDYLVVASRKLYNDYEREFIKWIKVNGKDIPEWKESCSNKSLKYVNVGGWFLKKRGGCNDC